MRMDSCSVDYVQFFHGRFMKIHREEVLRMFISKQDRLIAELTQQLHAAHDYILQQMGLKDHGNMGPGNPSDVQQSQ